jgi:uncharacterized membrane protein (UPF0127 family)
MTLSNRAKWAAAGRKAWKTRRRNDSMEAWMGHTIALLDVHHVDAEQLITTIVDLVAQRIHDL